MLVQIWWHKKWPRLSSITFCANVATKDTQCLSTSLSFVDEIDEPNVIQSEDNNNDIYLTAYVANTSKSLDTPFFAFIQIMPTIALASFSNQFNAILDSRCTIYILCDRKYFWTYNDENGVTPIGTANCGTLGLFLCPHRWTAYCNHSQGLPSRSRCSHQLALSGVYGQE